MFCKSISSELTLQLKPFFPARLKIDKAEKRIVLL